jgi:hypothetical protein
MAKDRDERFATCRDLVKAAAAALGVSVPGGGPVVVERAPTVLAGPPPPAPPTDVTRQPRSRQWVAVIAVVAVVGVIVAAVLAVAKIGPFADSDPSAGPSATSGAPPPASNGCAFTTAAGGADAAEGSAEAPFATVQHMVDLLEPGQTGCLRGHLRESLVTIDQGGSSPHPVTLRSEPGTSATLEAVITINGDFIVVRDLRVDATHQHQPLVQIHGAQVTIDHTEITTEGSPESTSCIYVTGAAAGTVITNNFIHDCGNLERPNQNAISLDRAKDTFIENNLIVRTIGNGVLLYRDSDGTRLIHNTIDAVGTGVLLSSDGGLEPHGLSMHENVVSNPTGGTSVISEEASDATPDNSVQNNCLFGTAGQQVVGGGLRSPGNHAAEPEYADPANDDYTVSPAGPCAGLGADLTRIPVGDSAAEPS